MFDRVDGGRPFTELVAERLLTRLLDLLGDRAGPPDDPVRAAERLGVTVPAGDDAFVDLGRGRLAIVSAGLDVRGENAGQPMIALRFEQLGDRGAGTAVVCRPDADAFRARLESDGFEVREWLGEHGRRMGLRAERGATLVEIATVGESCERPGHRCVREVRTWWTTRA